MKSILKLVLFFLVATTVVNAKNNEVRCFGFVYGNTQGLTKCLPLAMPGVNKYESGHVFYLKGKGQDLYIEENGTKIPLSELFG